MSVGWIIFVGLVVVGVVGYLVVDLWDSRRQRARLRGGKGRDDLDHFRVRGEKTINSDFGSMTARSVGDGRNRHGRS
ncbi:unannotated protein [freshwater metagenome]|uniref:Unannotated protein n=1 Tax=freshwater metagenome TaxID=449393 RepID=A0A6J6SH43_9ZZZZ|nr:hypothetical protein [Actinomycetota bacterium]